jgi:hypothetical protein
MGNNSWSTSCFADGLQMMKTVILTLFLLVLVMRVATSFVLSGFAAPRVHLLRKLAMSTASADSAVSYKVGFMFPGQGGTATSE